MHHGRRNERERAFSDGKRVPFLDDVRLSRKSEVIFQHRRRLLRSDDGDVRIQFDQPRERRGMVGLHVLHDDVVELPAVQRKGKIFKKQLAHGIVHRVEQNVLFVFQKIGIIRNAARNGIGALEQRDPSVVPAQIPEPRGDLGTVLHNIFLRGCFFGRQYSIFARKKQVKRTCFPAAFHESPRSIYRRRAASQ